MTDPDPTGNLAELLDNLTGTNVDAENLISNAFGVAADFSGALALVPALVALFGGGDPTQAALQQILTTIQTDFTQLDANLQAQNNILRLQNLDNITSPAQTQLELLQAGETTDITPCLNAINALALDPNAVPGVWQAALFSDQLFWTDSGQYFQFPPLVPTYPGIPHPVNALDAGYGQQTPPQVGDDVFSYLYVLPAFLRTLAIFIVVAGKDDPNWVTQWGPVVLQPVAAFLKNQVHDTIASQISQLSPGFWDGKGLWNAVGISPLVEYFDAPALLARPVGNGLGMAYLQYPPSHNQ